MCDSTTGRGPRETALPSSEQEGSGTVGCALWRGHLPGFDDAAIEEFLNLPRGWDLETLKPVEEAQWAARTPSGGVLLGMSDSVLEVSEPGLAPGFGLENALWLSTRLRNKGLIA